jgi:cell division transport system permease protein
VIDAVGELDRNPLLPTLIVSAKNANDYGKILAQIDSSEYSSLIKDKNFEDHQNIIGRINAFSEKARLVGLIFAVFFAVISILLIFNAIRITIYTHREEIGIMRLVGATNSFIRLPFIVESVFYGLFSVVITSALCFIICWLSAPYLNVFFGGYVPLIEYLRSGGVLVVGLELVGVVILTIISSGMAVARYLKV